MKEFANKMLSALFGRFQPATIDGVDFISTEEAEELIENGKAKLTLDVRTPEEYQRGHISGSTLAPLNLLGNHIPELSKHKNDIVVVYCRTQGRSPMAANMLAQAGFSDVRVMSGGFMMWVNGGRSVNN